MSGCGEEISLILICIYCFMGENINAKKKHTLNKIFNFRLRRKKSAACRGSWRPASRRLGKWRPQRFSSVIRDNIFKSTKLTTKKIYPKYFLVNKNIMTMLTWVKTTQSSGLNFCKQKLRLLKLVVTFFFFFGFWLKNPIQDADRNHSIFEDAENYLKSKCST